MTPIYLNPPSSPFIESNEDQSLQLLSPPSHASPSSSSLSFPIFFDPSNQDQGGSYDRELQQKYQQEADKYVSYGGSSDHQYLPIHSLPTVENDRENTLKLTICKQEDRDDNQSDNVSVKWMSSKMRVMKKMMNSDQLDTYKSVKTMQRFQDQQKPSSMLDTDSSRNYSSNNMNNTIRVCADCNTTKTPLWRSGPRGPKSLCNACGIRQRKARRAMAAAAAGNTLLTTKTTSIRSKVHHKEKRSDNGYVKQHKKRGRKKLCYEDFTISLSKNSAFHRVFPQDEKEAAILLMALSCGLVHG